jgi:amino acid permease
MTAQEVPPVPDTAHSASDEVVSSVPDGPGSPEVPDEESAEHSYEPLNRLLSETTSSTVVSDGASTAVVGAANMTCGHFVGAVANLCSATLGAGILALPFAMYESGLVFGVFLLLASGWATAASIDLIVQACDFYGLKTYESVVEQALGLKWRQTVEISILIFCGGTAVAYVIAVGDIMERLGDGINDTHKRLAMSLVWLLAMLPLSCLRKMQSLQCASSVGIVSIGTLLVAATVHLFLPSEYKPDGGFLGMQDLELFLWPHHGFISILRACPIFFFAYSCQVNVAQIYDELPGPRVAAGASSAENEETNRGRVRSMSWVTWVAIGLCTTLYASISYVTLMDFGDQVEPNILSCYRLSGRESTLLHLAFLAMALAVIMAFPLNVFPARVSIIQMWEAACAKHSGEPMLICVNDEEARQPLISKPGTTSTYNKSSGNNEAQMERGYEFDPLEPPRTPTPLLSQQSTLGDELQLAPGEEYEEPEFHARQHQFVTLLVAGSALGLALVVPNISVVFGLLGGTTSSLLGFVVPGMLGLAMDGPNKASSWTLIVAGTLVGVVTTGVTVYSTIREAF